MAIGMYKHLLLWYFFSATSQDTSKVCLAHNVQARCRRQSLGKRAPRGERIFPILLTNDRSIRK